MIKKLSIILIATMMLTACSDSSKTTKQKNEQSTEVSSSETSKKAIRKVLEHLFTGPDKKLIDLMWNPKYRTVINKKEENPMFDKYVAEVYGAYITDSYLDPFVSIILSQYSNFAYDNGYKLSVKKISIKQSEIDSTRYTFIAEVSYQKDEEKTVNVEGKAYFYSKEKGKISVIKIINDNGLSDKIRTKN
ncbi:hypothetical protein AN960_00455 [Bacillus sp. FJAT-25509]|uniref:hypothetical protein n=1 Tax=Bacillus sp. FJAT-25509 TaxID=1712029 RepID=UPI0006F305D4|nr:hypothetical protein [Bacillus sp. FJAT-25509]KQL41780.1 hypothetical protein AN960_00455 [Bacillus sp. FJAT-25509]